jgi:methylase of polypeptide subunit release factors
MLAAEVVELEEKTLKARSEELKREREAAAEREAAKRAQAAAKNALQERESLQSILDTLEVCSLTLRSIKHSLVHPDRSRSEEGHGSP